MYDAWGNGKVCNASGTENTSSSFIGNINPFRYRGYYYDVETGLYYLQTRYYDPQVGRFLSPDSVDYIAPDLIGGLNLYAYCNNNPVMPLEVFKDVMIGIGAGLTVGGLVFASAGVIVTAVSTAVSVGAALFSLGAAGANIGLFLVSAFTGKETPGPIEPPKIPDVIPTSPTILDYRTSSRKFENSKNFLYDHFVSILI